MLQHWYTYSTARPTIDFAWDVRAGVIAHSGARTPHQFFVCHCVRLSGLSTFIKEESLVKVKMRRPLALFNAGQSIDPNRTQAHVEKLSEYFSPKEGEEVPSSTSCNISQKS